MGYYFEDQESMFAHAGMRVERTLAAIARRYVGNNPPHPVTFRAYCKSGILRGRDYRYEADFNRYFPEAKLEEFVYAWSKYWSDTAASLMFDVTCLGPLEIYCNGETVFKSNIFTERYADARNRVTVALKAGWNHFVIRCRKTRAGFGVIFGSWLGKHPYCFMMPGLQREGQEGWLFTGPMSVAPASLPGPLTSEANSGLRWNPANVWERKRSKPGQLARIYGQEPGTFAVGWTRATFMEPGVGKYVISGRHDGPIAIFLGGDEVLKRAGSGKFSGRVSVPFGECDVFVKCSCEKPGWGFELTIRSGSETVRLANPCNISGTSQAWMYVGPFKRSAGLDFNALRDLNRIACTTRGDDYWRLDMPDGRVRMYNENPLYGRWNYPLGVTLYGLLHAARAIGSEEIRDYVRAHVQLCCDTFAYALWDKGQYGGATAVHHLLSSIDSLDDCGSFGSCMLEVARHFELRGFREIADYVADYITNKQARLPDGTFYRRKLMHIFHENTMWADDLYMSVPFLCRYFQLTGERRYIDDAARQFVGFRQRLFIPELKVMSHVFDFKREMATGVPWGRGNGWTLFSLTEILAVLPKDHPQRKVLMGMLRELCEGYLALQDPSGMWHQVLTHPDSYPETSCTSMFACAFARAVRNGWLREKKAYVAAVFKAWEALNRISIDRGGNVHGVCRGSEFSFTPEYYKKELLWNLNDTHGIGIVLLAGTEVLRLMQYLESGPGPQRRDAGM